MPELRFTLLIEEDGVALPNMPIIRRYNDAEAAVTQISQAADSNSTSYHEVASLTMPHLGILFLQTDLALNLKFNLNTPIAANANAVILMLGVDMAQATPTQNVELNNPSTTTAANVEILGGGT